jgi:hypothetical protein
VLNANEIPWNNISGRGVYLRNRSRQHWEDVNRSLISHPIAKSVFESGDKLFFMGILARNYHRTVKIMRFIFYMGIVFDKTIGQLIKPTRKSDPPVPRHTISRETDI